MAEDWIANAYKGMSPRQALAWKAKGFGLSGFAMAASPVDGELNETPTTGLMIAEGGVMSGGFRVPTHEARPSMDARYPVVLIIPEIFGMHEHIKDVTRRFAREGFLGVTFEPYARQGGVLHLPDIDAVRSVVDTVPDEQVLADLDSLLVYAKQHPAGRPDRIGVTGFCRGGMYTLLFAAHTNEFKAAVSWYGQLRPEKKPGIRTEGPLDVAARIHAPVLGLYGEADLGIPVGDVRQMQSALQTSGKTAEFILYPGAPHAFFADYRPSYRPEAAQDAWTRCVAWFKKYLQP